MWPFKKRCDCDLPTGPVFEETWTCPHCGTKWRLRGHANYSVWEKVEQ